MWKNNLTVVENERRLLAAVANSNPPLSIVVRLPNRYGVQILTVADLIIPRGDAQSGMLITVRAID